jgi:hypothetical protein
MAIAFRAGATGSDLLGTLAVTIPATVQGGDLMVLTYHTASDISPTDLPAGWTYVPETPDPGAVHVVGTSRMAALYRIAAGTIGVTSPDAETVVSLAVTAGAPVKQSCQLTAWSGCDQSAPIHKVTFSGVSGGLGTSHAVPAVTTTMDECTIIAWYGSKDSSVSAITVPSGYTSRGTVTQASGGRSNSAQASKEAALAGAYGGESWTTDAAPSSRGLWTIALAPPITTQTMRPAADETATNVADQAGSTTGLYAAVDESTLSTADYVTAVQAGIYEALLSTAAAPPAGSPLDVTYVLGLATPAVAATWDVYLLEGATELAHWTDEIDEDGTEVTHTLDAEDADAITDWADVRIRWVLTSVS